MEYLSAKNIPFDSRDLSANPVYRNELMALGSMGTPTVKIGDKVVIGMNFAKMDAALSEMSKKS
jgi:glutaredoxin